MSMPRSPYLALLGAVFSSAAYADNLCQSQWRRLVCEKLGHLSSAHGALRRKILVCLTLRRAVGICYAIAEKAQLHGPTNYDDLS